MKLPVRDIVGRGALLRRSVLLAGARGAKQRASTVRKKAAPVQAAAAADDAADASASSSRFERLTPVEHVLRRPGMYIGSTSVQLEPLWVHDADEGRIVWREAHYIPGLYKIFDEILVNALDNVQRDGAGTDRIDVVVEPLTGRTTVTNNGRGIPVRRHESEGVWIPEMVMGSLFTGSNFDDAVKRTVGGRHGFGAKLTNLFSTEFEVSTADSASGLKYTQWWAANMSERGEPTIEPLPKTARDGKLDYTTVRFTPDLGRFGAATLHADMLALFRRRVHDAAATAAPAVVSLDGEVLSVGGLADLAQLYAGRPMDAAELAFARPSSRWQVRARGATPPCIATLCADTVRTKKTPSARAPRRAHAPRRALMWPHGAVLSVTHCAATFCNALRVSAVLSVCMQVGACLSPTGAFQAVSFVNGVATPRAGTHVAHVATPLLAALAPLLSKQLKLVCAAPSNAGPLASAGALLRTPDLWLRMLPCCLAVPDLLPLTERSGDRGSAPQPAGEELTAARLKPHLMLFVDAKVDNPEFDSQSKEALTSPPASFGGQWTLPSAFVKKVAALEGLQAALHAAIDRRASKQLAKRTGKASGASQLLDVPKLEDAELAGGALSAECTLIVTEGDSAKALAVAGLEVVGRERYGVFPLRGKPLNVRETSMKKVGDNEELMGLMRALGLTPGAQYDAKQVAALKAVGELDGAPGRRGGRRGAKSTPASASSKGRAGGKGDGLRYGRLLLMADQDDDGSHIKGLIISMIHHFWPELLQADFVQEFQTPLLKARRMSDGQVNAS